MIEGINQAEAKVKELIAIFDNPTCGLFKRNIEDACKTLRKLPYFGDAAR